MSSILPPEPPQIEGVTNQFWDVMMKCREEIYADPCRAAFNMLGMRVWKRQEEMIEAPWSSESQHLFSTGHGVGKTHAEGALPVLWLMSHFPCAYVIITADSWSTITSKIFPGIRVNADALHKRIPIIFGPDGPPKVLGDKWTLGDKWQALGLSQANEETIRGWHSPGIYGGTMTLFDEGSAATIEGDKNIRSYSSGKRNFTGYFGNPTREDGPFTEIAREGKKGWVVHTISTLETPNYIEDREVIPGLKGREYVEEIREEYGEGSPEWKFRILGIPPTLSDRGFVDLQTILDCSKKDVLPAGQGVGILGIDVGRSPSGDPSAWVVRDDAGFPFHLEKLGLDAIEQASITQDIVRDHPYIRSINIDASGFGQALIDELIRLQDTNQFPDHLRIHAVHPGVPAMDTKRFGNLKAEMWCEMRKHLPKLYIPFKYLKPFKEISNMHRRFTQNELLWMEIKLDYKKRKGKSPNTADAASYTFFTLKGEHLFGEVQDKVDTLQVKCQPSIWGTDLSRVPFKEPDLRPGKLVRTWFINRRGTSAVIWAHVSEDNIVCVYRGRSWKHSSLEQIAADVMIASYDSADNQEVYRHDVCCAHEAKEGTRRNDAKGVIRRSMRSIQREGEKVRRVKFLPFSELAGVAGLDKLDFWIHNSIAGVTTQDFLVIWPERVTWDVEAARLRVGKSKGEDDELITQQAVGGGGPFVLCLRMLAMAVR